MRHNPETGEYEKYYRLKESYRNAGGRACTSGCRVKRLSLLLLLIASVVVPHVVMVLLDAGILFACLVHAAVRDAVV